MKRLIRVFALIGAALTPLLSSLLVLATIAYVLSFSITSTGTHTNLPIMATVNNTMLVDAGVISATGLDTRVLQQSAVIPHMVADNKTLFVSPSLGIGSTLFQYTTGNALLSAFDIIPGYNGYFTTADSAVLEPAASFNTTIRAYIDPIYTSSTANLTSSVTAALLSATVGGSWTAAQAIDKNLATAAFDCNTAGVGTYVRINFGVGNSTIVRNWRYYTQLATTVYAVWDVQASNNAVDWTTYYAGWSINATDGWHEASWICDTPYRYWQTIKMDDAAAGGDVEELQVSGYRIILDKIGSYEIVESGSGNITLSANWTTPICITASGLTVGMKTITAVLNAGVLSLIVDGVTYNAAFGGSISDLKSDYRFMLSNSSAYFISANLTATGAQRIFYQPVSIIQTTVLPNNLSGGLYPGTFVWGTNPANISIGAMSLAISGGTPFWSSQEVETPDVLPPYDPNTNTLPVAPTNPLSPLIDTFFATMWSLPSNMVWFFLALIAVVGSFIGVAKLLPNSVGWAGIVSCSVMGLCATVGILPRGMVIIAVIGLVAAIVEEVKA